MNQVFRLVARLRRRITPCNDMLWILWYPILDFMRWHQAIAFVHPPRGTAAKRRHPIPSLMKTHHRINLKSKSPAAHPVPLSVGVKATFPPRSTASLNGSTVLCTSYDQLDFGRFSRMFVRVFNNKSSLSLCDAICVPFPRARGCLIPLKMASTPRMHAHAQCCKSQHVSKRPPRATAQHEPFWLFLTRSLIEHDW